MSQKFGFGLWSVVLGAVGLCAVFGSSDSVLAQRNGAGGGRGGAAMNPLIRGPIEMTGLAQLEEVKKEIKLTDDQVEAIKTMQQKLGGKMREAMQANQGDREAMTAARAEMAVEISKGLMGELTEDQQQRLIGVFLQVNGGLALTDKTVAGMLKLSPEQVEKLESTMAESRGSMRKSMQGMAEMEAKEREEKIASFIKERSEGLLEVLTADQNSAFEKAQGEALKVDLSKLARAGGRGGAGGGGRGGAGGGAGGRGGAAGGGEGGGEGGAAGGQSGRPGRRGAAGGGGDGGSGDGGGN